jgi:hypothetical protein
MFIGDNSVMEDTSKSPSASVLTPFEAAEDVQGVVKATVGVAKVLVIVSSRASS